MNAKTVYLIAAVIGAIAPYIFFVQHVQEHGYGLFAFVENLFVSHAASGFTADLLVSSAVLWIFVARDSRKGKTVAGMMAVNLLIGLSCALPLYLYLRERSA